MPAPDPEPSCPRPVLDAEDWLRIQAALRYQGRDLHHRSYAVDSQHRELLWAEMDSCLALADRIADHAREIQSANGALGFG